MVVYAALEKGMWTEIKQTDFEHFSRWGTTINAYTGKEVIVCSRFTVCKAFDVFIDGELYAWCRPVDNKAPDRRVYVV